MDDKDYYKIMGVSRDASEKDIKIAYRKLARKYHPDISKEAQAEERFKEMGEAYEVLRDPAKRKEYDQYLENKAFNQAHASSHTYGRDAHQYTQAFDGDLFESLFGYAHQAHRPMQGHSYTAKVTISLEEAFHGAVKQLQVPIEKDSGTVSMQTLKVKIPAGIKSGQQIRLAGQGAKGIHGGARGDILLTIHVNKHTLFDVMDNDIYLTLPVAPWEAALGATIAVPTLSGTVDLKIPSGSQGGQKLRLKNKGLPGKAPGHQYVLLKMITPPPTTEAAKELYQKMAETMPFNPREKMGAS